MAKREINSKVDLITIRFAGDSVMVCSLLVTSSLQIPHYLEMTLQHFQISQLKLSTSRHIGWCKFIQLQFSNQDIHTPGDKLDVLVAMNPAALKVNLADLKTNGMIVANTANYNKKNFTLAGYETDPLEDGSLDEFKLIKVDMDDLVNKALEDIDLPSKMKSRIQICLRLVYCIGFMKEISTRLFNFRN